MDRKCFHCLSKDTWRHKLKGGSRGHGQWHTAHITIGDKYRYKVLYCHRCYCRYVYRAKKMRMRAKQIAKLPSVITNV